ncbi:MAG: hypothetical protein EAZ72_04855 [Verrucomicrobia bacterium]|nr:MAG: hypothetical protein EAZ72_04855 [Verrucomicrobiota bacterium]
MRLLAALLLLPLTLAAQSGNYSPKQHVRIQADADHLVLPVSVTIKGKDRAAVDARVDAIRKELEKRFADQPGWELREISAEFARAEAKSYVSRPAGGSKLFGDDEDQGDTTYASTARWELHTEADKGLKGVETLRTKAEGLVKAKSDDEKQVVGHPEYVLTNPQDYRNELLDQIKADFEEAKKHLPEGQWTLELSGLAGPVNVVALGGKRFEVSLTYRMAFLTPKPEKATK